MVSVTQSMSGCRIASSTRGKYHLQREVSSTLSHRIYSCAHRAPEEVGDSDGAHPGKCTEKLEKYQYHKDCMLICGAFANFRNLQKTMVLPSRGRGCWFEPSIAHIQ